MVALGKQRLYWRLVRGAIKTVEILQHLTRLYGIIGRRPLVVWDDLPPHRTKTVATCLPLAAGNILVERLLGYAPELDPIELIRANLKRHEMENLCQNLCRNKLNDIKAYAAKRLQSIERHAALAISSWKQSGLEN